MQETTTHAGHILSRRSRATGGTWFTLYDPTEQGIDVDGARYALVCEAHGAILGVQQKVVAGLSIAYPDWCPVCQAVMRKRGTLAT